MVTLPKINNPDSRRAKILVAPLDWGLGHATRCVPIIKELLNNKCEVWIAASGDQKALLKEEFPILSFVEIPGYEIKYGKNRALTFFKLLRSIPKILIRIKREKKWLHAFLVCEKPDMVISDNRYGLYAPGITTVFITHQLCIRTALGGLADRLLRMIHYRMINRFSYCWVPDGEGVDSLAGELSHPGKLPAIPTRYIGPLSRLERVRSAGTAMASEHAVTGSGMAASPDVAAAGPDLLIILSGPEPQRTIFETILLRELTSYSGNAVLVRGLPGRGGQEAQLPPGVQIYDHLPARQLNAVMNDASIVISRAGYSTIMDLMKLGKKAILVPTPGQTEQEYLGDHLAERKAAICMRQSDFSLTEALAKANGFPFVEMGGQEDGLLGTAVRSLLRGLGY